MGTAASVALRHNRDFRRLWIGQVLSQIGTGAASLAHPLLILTLTHSAVLAGVMGTVRSVVAIGLQLPGGALADRFDRRLTMVICDGTRAVVLAALAAVVVAGTVWWPVVAAVSVIDAAGGALFSPASNAALPVVVPKEQLETAWAVTEARQYASGLAGPALGGVLYAAATALPFGADAISYVVSAVTASRLHGDFFL